MQIRPIAIRSKQNVLINKNKTLLFQEKQDSLSYETIFVNKKPLIARGIIPSDKNINAFFEEISTQIFPDSNIHHSLSNLLKMGYVAFSTSTYNNLADPKSAIGIKLDKRKSAVQHCALLEEYIKNGVGVGINFSELNNPIYEIKKINE